MYTKNACSIRKSANSTFYRLLESPPKICQIATHENTISSKRLNTAFPSIPQFFCPAGKHSSIFFSSSAKQCSILRYTAQTELINAITHTAFLVAVNACSARGIPQRQQHLGQSTPQNHKAYRQSQYDQATPCAVPTNTIPLPVYSFIEPEDVSLYPNCWLLERESSDDSSRSP